MCWLFRKPDLSKTLADLMTHQEEKFVKITIIAMMRRYARTTSNTIDDALVDEIQRRLLMTYRYSPEGVIFEEPALFSPKTRKRITRTPAVSPLLMPDEDRAMSV